VTLAGLLLISVPLAQHAPMPTAVGAIGIVIGPLWMPCRVVATGVALLVA
jgi:hypothetical protein